MSTTPDHADVRVFPPLIYLAGLIVSFLAQRWLPLPIVPAALVLPIRVLGVILLFAWLALALWAVLTFRRVGTTPKPAGPATALALGGPYRFTRNPMYLSLVFMTAGIAFVANTLWPLILLPAVVLVVRRAVIDREERYLTARFGQEYVAYAARVRRWV
jgi:protein-S-isoprenylcysteine O-methyltransferase Ste14